MGFLMMSPLRRGLLLFTGAIVVASIAGCVAMRFPRVMTMADDDWSMEAGGPLRSNVVADSVRVPYRVLWEFDSKAGLRSVPLVRDSVILLGNMRGDLVLFDLAKGKPLGSKAYGLSVEATPLLAGYLLFLPLSSQEGIIAIDVKDGSVRWRGTAGPVASSPLVVEERLYVAALSGNVHCLNRYTGEQLWMFESSTTRPRPIRSSPAYADGSVIVGADDGRVTALDAATGALRWRFQAGGSIFATPLLTGSMVVVPSLDSTVYGLDRGTGALRWRFNAGSIFYGPAAGDGQFIYVGAGNGKLFCLDAETGSLQWTFTAASVINSAPLVAANAVVVGSLDRTLYVLDRSNGKELWRIDLPGRLRISPVLWSGYLIVATENRDVMVLVPDESSNP